MAEAAIMTFQFSVSRLVTAAAFVAGSFFGCKAELREFGEPAGNGGSGDGGSDNSGGSDETGGKGGGGTSGAGGKGGGTGGKGAVCEGGAPVCDGDRATLCLPDGSGFEDGGSVCGTGQVCRRGECVDEPCTAGELFCLLKELRRCTGEDGGASEVVEECAANEYCNGETKACARQVCTPKTRQCGAGAQPQLCKDDGSGWANDGEACGGDEPLCELGICQCVPSTERCSPSGEQPQRCTDDHAWIAREEPCEGAMYTGCRKASSAQFAKAQCVASTVQVPFGTYNRVVGARTSVTYVDNFKLDRYEVTVGQFRRFVNALLAGYELKSGSGKHAHNGGNGLVDAGKPGLGYEGGWDNSWDVFVVKTFEQWNDAHRLAGGSSTPSPYATWTAQVGDNENKPINQVNWYEAYAYCIWDNGFLPSEAEWEWAARGAEQGNKFPWPDSVVAGNNSNVAVYGCFFPNNNATCDGSSSIAEVDKGPAEAGANRYGHAHLGGNVWEWTLDWHHVAGQDLPTYPDNCRNCAILTVPNPSPDNEKVHRGGDFYWYKEDMENAAHRKYRSYWRDYYGGFRCARPQ